MQQQIEYFIVDLDGCVSEPFTSPNWHLISQLRELSDRSINDPDIPQLTICTGRPAPYTEAVGQWLNVQLPVIFESGAGMLNLNNQQLLWNPALPNHAKQVIDKVMHFITDLNKDFANIHPEISKQMDAGFTSDDTELISHLLPIFTDYVMQHCPELEVHSTPISMSALWPQANKGAGLHWLCEHLQTQASAIAYIGDTSGDIPAMKYASISFAPANANKENKQLADKVTTGSATAGVLEAWLNLIQHNKSLL